MGEQTVTAPRDEAKMISRTVAGVGTADSGALQSGRTEAASTTGTSHTATGAQAAVVTRFQQVTANTARPRAKRQKTAQKFKVIA